MLSLNLQGEGICRAGKKLFPDKVNPSNICNHHEIVKRHFHFYRSFQVMLKICIWPLYRDMFVAMYDGRLVVF